MIKKYLYSAITALSLTHTALAYDKDLETLYEDNTLIYSKVNSIEKLAKIDPAHPIAKLLEHPAFREYLMGVKEDNKDKDELMNEVETFFKKHCTNRASFGLVNIGIGKPNTETTNSENLQALLIELEPKYFSILLTIDCTATQEEVDELLKLFKEFTPTINAIVNEKFEGVSYSIIEHKKADKGETEETDLYVALIDELLIITFKENDIKDAIGKIVSPSKEKTLAANPKYLDAADKLDKYDISMFMRLDKVYKLLIENEETSLLNYLDANPSLKTLISTSAIKNDLHLDAFDSAFWGAILTKDGGEMKAGYSVKSKEGIAALVQYDKFIPEIPKYAFEGFKSMSVSSYDFKSNMLQLEKMFKKVSPLGFMAARAQAGELYALAKTNFFENLEPYFVQLKGHLDPALQSKRSSSKVYVFKVKNAALIYELLEKGKEMGALITTQDFLGEKVYKMPNQNDLSYYAAVVNNLLVVTLTSEDDMWRHIISQIKKPGKDIASHKSISDMWNTMPNEEVSMSYDDLGQMIMDSYFKTKKRSAKLTKAGIDIDLGQDEAPNVEGLNYSLITKFYQEENSWYSHMMIKDYSPHEK